MLLEPKARKWGLDKKERAEMLSYLPKIEAGHHILVPNPLLHLPRPLADSIIRI